ncbi:MAG: EamA family transporter [Alphaproteobacteria bacterium]|nr:EamA family transporter [Alphaproteobacteria bacterium]
MDARDWARLLLLALVWGGSFFFVGVAVAELPPLTLVAARVALAALALAVILRLAGIALPTSPALWGAFLGMGVLNNVVPFTLIVWGQTQIASGLAAILNATTPLFTLIVAHVATRDERLTGQRLVGVAIGIAGVAVIVGGSALEGLTDAVPAQLACLGGALTYACAGVFGRRFKALGVAPPATAFGQLAASAAVMVPLALLVDRPWLMAAPSAATLGAVVGLALVSTALAYVLYFRILASAGATNLLLVTFLIPPTAIALGILVLGETLAGRHLVGLAVIGAGLAVIDGRLPPRRRRVPG